MPGLFVGDVVQLNLPTMLFEQQCINTFHYVVNTAGTGSVSVVSDLDDLLTRFDLAGGLQATWITCVSLSNVIGNLELQQIKPIRSVKRFKVPTLAAGARPATSSTNLSAVITRGTDSGARGQVGSIHLPGLADTDQVTGEVLPALLAFMSALGSAMLDDVLVPVTGLKLKPVLFHPDIKDNTGHVTRPWFVTPLTRTIPQPTIRVMRRRTVGVGR